MIEKILFLTGNARKLAEAQAIMGDAVQIDNQKLDLPEIQSVETEKVVIDKLSVAYRQVNKPLFCEDTGLHIKNMNDLPGALVKWYQERLGNKGICKFSAGSKAYAETCIGYHDGTATHFFKGRVQGIIAQKPQGKGFGWDPTFIPQGHKKSFAQMTSQEKDTISMRSIAFRKFLNFLLRSRKSQ